MAHVLVIDDDALLRRVLRLTLEDHGHTVTDAANGRIGLTLWATHRADVVLTDMDMPELHGMQVLEYLAQDRDPPSLIAMSGCFPAGYRQRAETLGAVCFQKPFEMSTLIDSIAVQSPAIS